MVTGSPVRADQTLTFDLVVVGAGVAGLVAALDLLELVPGAHVAVLDKGGSAGGGSTPLAQGGMAAAVGPGDSPALHAADTVRAGDGLCDRSAVAVMTAEGPARVDDLVARGARFDRTRAGGFALAREGGQTVARSVRAADASGAEIFRTLRVAATGRVTRLRGVACALPQDGADGRVGGVWALLAATGGSPSGPEQEGGMVLLRAPAVVLATGGCGGLFAATTNPDGATADGVALAYEAGADLVDLEFVQFHPTGLRPAPGRPATRRRLLLTEALRGAGAVLVDERRERIMASRHPDGDLAPRHVVTKAILDQPGGAWLDATGLDPGRLATEFPTVTAGARRYGFDLGSDLVPVEPCQHYMIGGVATDLAGRTTVPGLYAVGEVASTGVHGANRMAGNSLLQACVFGHRAAAAVAAALGDGSPVTGDPSRPALPTPAPGADLVESRAEVRETLSAGAGPIRDAEGLQAAAKRLDVIGRALGPPAGSGGGDRNAVELSAILTAGRLIVRSALLREESRGVHWRSDAPARSDRWAGVRLRVRRPDR